MALTYVGGGSAVGTSATYSVNLTTLTGGSGSTALAGDIVVVVWGWGTNVGADAALTMNSLGYTYAFADVWSDDTRETNMRAAWKIMTSTPDTTCIANGPNNAAYGGGAVVQVWRGAATTLTGTASATTGLNSNHGNPPAITPAVAGSTVIAMMAGSGATTATGTKTAPTNYSTYHVSVKGDGTGADCYIAMSARAGLPASAQDPGAYSGGTTSTSDGWCAGTLALAPAATVAQVAPVSATGAVLAPSAGVLVLAQVDPSVALALGSVLDHGVTSGVTLFDSKPILLSGSRVIEVQRTDLIGDLFILRIARCTTATPAVWSSATNYVHVMMAVSRDGGNSWEDVGGGGAYGGIQPHPDDDIGGDSPEFRIAFNVTNDVNRLRITASASETLLSYITVEVQQWP
jgi:hypothetical protein